MAKKYLGLDGLNRFLENLSQKFASLGHLHDDRYYTENEINSLVGTKNVPSQISESAASTLASAKSYTDKQLEENVDALETAINNKANSSDLTNHTSNKANPHNVTLSQLGVTATAAELNTMDGVTVTASEINALDGVTENIQTQLDSKAISGHIHSSYVNQNAFSNVKVGETTIVADTTTDTLTMVAGNNVTITPDATNDKITISAKDTVYTHPNSGVTAGTFKSVTVNAAGHVTGGSNPTTLSGYGITDAASSTELAEHIDDSVAHLTSAERTKWNSGYSHSTSSHAPTNAEKNIIIGIQKNGTDIAVDSSTRKVNIVVPTKASDVGADPSGTATSAVSSHNTSASAHEDIRTEIEDHIENVSNPHSVTKSQIGLGNVENKSSATIRSELTKSNVTTALGYTPPTTNTTYGVATQSDSGLMSATDKAKLDNIASGANKTIVDSAMSSTSTNPVQNKVVNSAISSSASSTLSSAKSYTDTKISDLINSAPTTLDTLGEIATAMEENADVVEALEASIGNKANASDLTSHTGNKSNPHGVTLSQLGVTATATELNYVDGVTSAIQTQLNGKAASSHNHAASNITSGTLSSDRLPTVPASKGGTGQTTLTNSANALINSLGEGDSNPTDDSCLIAQGVGDYSDKYYRKPISYIWNYIKGKADSVYAAKSHGTHVTYSTSAPAVAGTASAGSASNVARGDHVHPAQTTISGNAGSASKVNNSLTVKLNGGSTEGTNLFTFNGSAAKSVNITPSAIGAAASSHSHSSYVNQNAFSNVVVGSTTISADSATDTVTLVAGSNVTITPDATNDKITIASKDTVYTHPTSSGNKHIPAGGSSGQILRWSADGTAAWGADNNTTYSAATQSAQGLMSAADKTKLDGIAAGANAYSLPTASSSTLGGVKTTSTVTSTSGLTACPIISGVPYYKDTNTTYTLGSFGVTATAAELNILDGVTATAAELNFVDGVTSNIQTQLNGKASSSHTHNYAGSSSAGGAATSANKLNTNAGSTTQPVYFSNGVPTATTYSLAKSVPSNAVFTDTKNTAGSTDTSSKIFLIGATSQAANPQTYSHDTVYVDASSRVVSNNGYIVGANSAVTMQYDSTNKCLNFVFA